MAVALSLFLFVYVCGAQGLSVTPRGRSDRAPAGRRVCVVEPRFSQDDTLEGGIGPVMGKGVPRGRGCEGQGVGQSSRRQARAPSALSALQFYVFYFHRVTWESPLRETEISPTPDSGD